MPTRFATQTVFLDFENYAALGDGRSVALSGADGAIDWWCVPNMDSAPLFDRLLDGERGGTFSITPVEPFTIERRYRPDSNVLETIFVTASGRAKLVESLNSGPAGRLPWAELARRVEGWTVSSASPSRCASAAGPIRSAPISHPLVGITSFMSTGCWGSSDTAAA